MRNRKSLTGTKSLGVLSVRLLWMLTRDYANTRRRT